MTFSLTMECDNAAFCDCGGGGNDDAATGIEVARILKEVAHRIETNGAREGDGWNLFDANGNKIGEAYAIQN